MVGFEEGIAAAQEHYAKTGEKVTGAWDHPQMWIFFGSIGDGRRKAGGHYICINKMTGAVSFISLPSKEGFKVLDDAAFIRL